MCDFIEDPEDICCVEDAEQMRLDSIEAWEFDYNLGFATLEERRTWCASLSDEELKWIEDEEQHQYEAEELRLANDPDYREYLDIVYGEQYMAPKVACTVEQLRLWFLNEQTEEKTEEKTECHEIY